MKKYIVYRHSSKTTGKVYIGITCQNPIKRWGAGNNYKGCLHFYSAILKYGWDDFEHTILHEHLSKSKAIEIEKSLIAYYKALSKSYNMTEGGDGVIQSTKVSNDTRDKMSKAHKGQMTGEKNPMFGKHHDKEWKDRNSKMMKERHRNTPHPMGKKVICDGVMFQNIAECAKVYGQDRTTMSRWLRGKYKMPQKFVKLGLRYYSEDD